MDNLRELLLTETIRFLELCQTIMLNGRISIEDYYSMTNIKFKFLDNTINLSESEFFIDKDTSLRLKKIYKVDNTIYGTNKNAVGN